MSVESQKKDAYLDIKKDGLVITVTSITKGAYDPDLDSYPETKCKVETYGLIVNKTHKSIVSGRLISISEQSILVSGYGLPELTDQDKVTVTVKGTDFSVSQLNPVQPNGVTILYKMELK